MSEDHTQTPADTMARRRRTMWWLLGILGAVVIAIPLVIGYRCYRQYTLVKQINDVYGMVHCEAEYPEWMWDLLGDRMVGIEQLMEYDDYSDSPESALLIVAQLDIPTVYLGDSEVTPRVARAFADMPSLYTLEIASYRLDESDPITQTISRDVLAELSRSRSITEFAVSGFSLPDDTFQILGRMRQVRKLAVVDCQLSDTDITPLAELPELTSLSLSGDSVTAENLRIINRLSQLETLDLSDCPLTVEQLQQISGMSRLKSLNLSYTEFTEAGLAQLANLEHLEFLSLAGTQITDESVAVLYDHPSLKRLEIQDTNLSDEGIQQLRDHLPGCDVVEYFRRILPDALVNPLIGNGF